MISCANRRIRFHCPSQAVTTLETRGIGVKSLTNGIVDTTTAHGKLVFGMFALMAEYEAALIKGGLGSPREISNGYAGSCLRIRPTALRRACYSG
jgi:Resolvase, N terminal domain